MSKERATIGSDGQPLPLLPPEREAKVCGRMVRVMFYLPGFMALLLIKSGEPAGFGIAVELLMLASGASIVGGLFIGADSTGAGSDAASKASLWSGMLVLELLSVVPFLCALPALFHELAHSALLHARIPATVDVALGYSELLPMVAILPFILYELAGFGTLYFILPRVLNWLLNALIFGLIVASYVANRQAQFLWERRAGGLLVIIMMLTVFYGVLKLKAMQADYDLRLPAKAPK